MTQDDHQPILKGLRVVEIVSHEGLAAPFCGMLLAEQGAEVIRVISPQDPVDPVLDALLARNKAEIVLDLTTTGGKERLGELLKHADVVFEDASQANRVDIESARNENEGLITCHIPAFLDDDPRRSLPGYEQFSGSAGFLYNKPLGKPRYHLFPIASVTAALFAVNGIAAALVARLRRSGKGQRVDISRYGSSLVSQVVQILVKAGVPRGFLPLKMIGSPFMRCWECSDERFVYLHITLPTHNERMLELLEENGFSKEVRALRESIMSKETMRDPSQVKSIAEAKKIKEIYSAIFKAKRAQEWEEILGDELCCIKVREIEEWLEDSLEAGMTDACEIEDPVFGRLLGPGASVTLADHLVSSKPRVMREENVVALEQSWKSTISMHRLNDDFHLNDIGPLTQGQSALSGFKVLDLSRVIAGPCAARMLAEFGADVISLQSETRLDWALSFHLIFNAGKKSVTLDFKDEEGKKTLWKLIESYSPDAFIHNYRHLDLARSIGVGPETMLKRFPKLAYTHLNAYGNDGIWKDRPGFEQVVQAVSGIQMAYAEKGRPKLLPSPIIDIGCGLLGSFGTLLSFYKRIRTGQGALATTHLTNVSVLIQIDRIAQYQRDACLERAKKAGYEKKYNAEREILGGFFKMVGDYVMVAGPRGDIRKWLVGIHMMDDTGAEQNQELEYLKRALRFRTPSNVEESFKSFGVDESIAILSYPRISKINKEIRKYDSRDNPIVCKREFAGCEQKLTFISNPIRMSDTPLSEISTPPERGAHTEEVLGALGIKVNPGEGIQTYPPNKPFFVWLASFVRWGYFAWKSGNI